jgi:hypothetical protein
MANHSLRASMVYRVSGDGSGTARQLAARFRYSPRNSLAALLAQAGPFFGDGRDRGGANARDAFAFRNSGGWNMSVADARILRERFQRQVDVVKLIGIEALRASLSVVRIDVPVIPTFNLPSIVVSEVVRRMTGPLTDRLLDAILAGDPSDYGRCGGMAFAGLDYFMVGQDVVEDTAQPGSGPLRQYIWTRLLDSLDLNVTRFLEWTMQLHVLPVISKGASALIGAVAGAVVGGPVGAAIGSFMAGKEDILGLGGPKVLGRRTAAEWNRLRSQLDAGPAWPIGLIYGDTPLVWKQHQILALRYQDLGGGNVRLFVWDNNDGRMERTWIFNPTAEVLTVQGNSRDIKGIVCDDYTFRVPPRV